MKKKPKLRYLAAATFASVSISMTATTLVLALEPFFLWILGGPALGGINVLTMYAIRNQTDYDW